MPIKLTVYKTPETTENLIGVVRISPAAEQIVRQLQRATGHPVCHIVSQIIIQAADQIEIEEVKQ